MNLKLVQLEEQYRPQLVDKMDEWYQIVRAKKRNCDVDD